QVGDLPIQHGVGLETDGVAEAFPLQQAQQLWTRVGGVAPKELGDVEALVACDHRQQHPPPELGARVAAPPEPAPLQVAELVEEKQGVVTGATEVAVVGAALPNSVKALAPNNFVIRPIARNHSLSCWRQTPALITLCGVPQRATASRGVPSRSEA